MGWRVVCLIVCILGGILFSLFSFHFEPARWKELNLRDSAILWASSASEETGVPRIRETSTKDNPGNSKGAKEFTLKDVSTVFVTKSGKKLHRESCFYLARSKIEMTIEQALAMGYKPCSRCFPQSARLDRGQQSPRYSWKQERGNGTTGALHLPKLSDLLPAELVRIVDGDTLVVKIISLSSPAGLFPGKPNLVKLRLIGIDTPELRGGNPSEPLAEEAREFLRKMVMNTELFVELDVQTHDRYGRLLGYLWARNKGGKLIFVNAELLRAQLAQLMTIPPNVKYADYFVQVKAQTRDKARGLPAVGSARPQNP